MIALDILLGYFEIFLGLLGWWVEATEPFLVDANAYIICLSYLVLATRFGNQQGQVAENWQIGIYLKNTYSIQYSLHKRFGVTFHCMIAWLL